jgi:hypothetical protein
VTAADRCRTFTPVLNEGPMPSSSAHSHVTLSPAQKARKINIDTDLYGTFAEIGAGQETVRHFFRAGPLRRPLPRR